MYFRNMFIKYYAAAGYDGGAGGGAGGSENTPEITPEIESIINERVNSAVTGLKTKIQNCWAPSNSKKRRWQALRESIPKLSGAF